MTAEPLFIIENLVKTRAGEQGYELLIRRLRVARGARIAITGPSGCGKSTTLDILGMALRPDSAARFAFATPDGVADVMALWEKGQYDRLAALRLKYMGYVLQSGELLPFLTIRENMTLPARMAGMAPAEAIGAAEALAADLRMHKRLLDAMPGTLSVGERQRAAIVRALVARPLLILADEPTAALDPRNAGHVMEAFLRVIDAQKSTLILVTHNAEWAREGGLAEIAFPPDRGAGEKYMAILDDGAAGGAA